MALGIIGKKAGMTRVFADNGDAIPVTVIEVEANTVTQVKTEDNDGYRAIQITTGTKKASHVNKPSAGHFAKAKTEAGRGLWEFRLDTSEGEDLDVGSTLTAEMFEVGQKVDVRGKSIGKGFAGVIKRYNFHMQDATHGNSLSHRAPGSIGQCQTPGRVFKGKKMSGHMGNVFRTSQNLTVVRVDAEKNMLLVKGAVPGSKNGDVIITPAMKG